MVLREHEAMVLVGNEAMIIVGNEAMIIVGNEATSFFCFFFLDGSGFRPSVRPSVRNFFRPSEIFPSVRNFSVRPAGRLAIRIAPKIFRPAVQKTFSARLPRSFWSRNLLHFVVNSPLNLLHRKIYYT